MREALRWQLAEAGRLIEQALTVYVEDEETDLLLRLAHIRLGKHILTMAEEEALLEAILLRQKRVVVE